MTLQEYRKVRLVMVIAVSIVFSQAIYFKNYLVPIAVLAVSSLVLLYFRRTVKEIVADERDFITGGKAALIAIRIYSFLAVTAMFIFYALRDFNPAYEPIGLTLAYSICILMLLYAVIFRYYNRISFSNKRLKYSIFALALFLIIFVAGARLFSGEDDWVCENGKWIEHGHPDFAAPQVECK